MSDDRRGIFVATHPRACSTAFERVFMTRRDTLTSIHEPFGDAYYYGPERLGARYENDEKGRVDSGFSKSTYATIFDRIAADGADGKRVFVKDMAYYLFPPDGMPATIAPSLMSKRKGVGTDVAVNGEERAQYPYNTPAELGNPTVVPVELLQQFHFAFLIRDPHSSIPSYYRCTIPPLDEKTGWYDFYASEAGYDELVRFFHFLRATNQVGPRRAEQLSTTLLVNGHTEVNNGITKDVDDRTDHIAEICVIDADDLLNDPDNIIQSFCKSVGFEYNPAMMDWDNEEDHEHAKEVFAKWPGFHEDAIDSKNLTPRATRKKERPEEEWDAEWRQKYGEKGARFIRKMVDDNMQTYLYLKQFAIKPTPLAN